MLTTQLPSVPSTPCPPTILVLMCTKHDILGRVASKHGDAFSVITAHFNEKQGQKKKKVQHSL